MDFQKLKLNEKIKQVREYKFYSREFLADSLNISYRAFANIESGKTDLTVKRLYQILAVLGVSYNELISFGIKSIKSENNLEKSIDFETHNLLLSSKDEIIKELREKISLLNVINNNKVNK